MFLDYWPDEVDPRKTYETREISQCPGILAWHQCGALALPTANSVTVEIPRMQIFRKTRNLARAGRLVDSTYDVSPTRTIVDLSVRCGYYLAIS
jgi:hypothetical protein